jgi:hypothetical protein
MDPFLDEENEDNIHEENEDNLREENEQSPSNEEDENPPSPPTFPPTSSAELIPPQKPPAFLTAKPVPKGGSNSPPIIVPEAPLILKKAPRSSTITLNVDGQDVEFTRQEDVVGKTLYFILVICIIFIVGAIAWTISDLILPTGKLAGFLKLPFGAQLAILGVGLFVLFLLLITFYALYKRGSHALTKLLFTSKRLYREMKVKPLAKVMTGGLMVAILLVTIGLASLVVQIAAFGPSTDTIISFFQKLTGGEFALMVGLFAIGFTGMAIGFEWLWNVGNIFFARKFLKA